MLIASYRKSIEGLSLATGQSVEKLTVSAKEPQTTSGNSWWINTSAPHYSDRTTLRHVLHHLLEVPQWDCTPAAHSSHLLINTHGIGFLPFLVSISHSPARASCDHLPNYLHSNLCLRSTSGRTQTKIAMKIMEGYKR